MSGTDIATPADARAGLFRAAALERLERPEEIGRAMGLVRTPYRGTLILIALALAAFLAASVVLRVPMTVVASGVMLHGTATLETTVASQHEGMVTSLAVAVGDLVHDGDVVATIAQPALEEDLRLAREENTAARDRLATVRELQEASLATLGPLHAHLKAEGADSLARLNQRQTSLTTLLAQNDRLRTNGLVTQDRYLQIQAQLAETQDTISAKKAALLNLEIDWAEKQNGFTREVGELDDRIAQTRRQIERLEGQIRAAGVVRASGTGRVAEIKLAAGDLVRFNSPVVGLVPADAETAGGVAPLVAIALVPLSQGKRVKVGDAAFVDPASVRRDVYGQIRGTVTNVSPTPVTPELLHNLLRNDDLVRSMTAAGPSFLVTVALERSDLAPTGYAWTSSNGPDTTLSAGTPLRSEIETERVPLISLLVPALKEMLRFAPNDTRVAAASPA